MKRWLVIAVLVGCSNGSSPAIPGAADAAVVAQAHDAAAPRGPRPVALVLADLQVRASQAIRDVNCDELERVKAEAAKSAPIVAREIARRRCLDDDSVLDSDQVFAIPAKGVALGPADA